MNQLLRGTRFSVNDFVNRLNVINEIRFAGAYRKVLSSLDRFIAGARWLLGDIDPLFNRRS